MALPANWTTVVPADKSIREIMAILARFRAREIRLELAQGTGETMAISFAIEHPQQGLMPFRLPADGVAVQRVLTREFSNQPSVSRSHMSRKVLTIEHARNVAWRICRDWLRAQLSLIELEMVTLETVMLPYLLVEGDKPLHKVLAEGGLQRLLPPPAAGRS